MSRQTRWPFELDQQAETAALTAPGGVPLVIEAVRTSGAAAVLDAKVVIKRRQRGLPPAQLVEGLLSLGAAGGERGEDLAALREDAALTLLLGHGLPAPQTARDFLDAFDQATPPLWQGERAAVPGEGPRLQGLAQASRRLVAWQQERVPQTVATLDVDATILESQKRAARWTYDGRTGYQPVVALWAEQDVILADEFRDGNVPAGSGNRRVVEQALTALPAGVEEIRRRADSALYEQALLRWLEARGIGYAISADMSHELAAAIRALPESAWQIEGEDGAAIRQWAEVPSVSSDGVSTKERPAPPRYLAMRITKKQGRLFADGAEIKHFAIVTNRPDPADGSGLDLIRWPRGKAGTIEHSHHVLTNELAAEALPSQRFGANAAWFRLNVMLYNLLSAFKRVALPEELHDARPKRLRFVLLNGLGKVVRHARELVLRLVGAARRRRPSRPRHRPTRDARRLSGLPTAPPPAANLSPAATRGAGIDARSSRSTRKRRAAPSPSPPTPLRSGHPRPLYTPISPFGDWGVVRGGLGVGPRTPSQAGRERLGLSPSTHKDIWFGRRPWPRSRVAGSRTGWSNPFARARRAGHRLEEVVRQVRTDAARQRRQDLVGEIEALTERPRAKYGGMPDSAPLIREIQDRDMG